MTERRSAVFLERQNYRRRRLVDAIRVLPFAGLVLWMVPLLWPTSGPGAFGTASAIIYLFGIWAALLVLCALLSRLIEFADPRGEDAEGDGGP